MGFMTGDYHRGVSKGALTVRSGEEGPAIPVGTLLRRLGALAWRHRWTALPAVLATIGLQALTLVGLAGQGLAIDVVRAAFDRTAPAPHWPAWAGATDEWTFRAQVAFAAGIVLGSALLAAGARFLVRFGDERFVQACVVDLRQRLYEKLQQLPFSFFDAVDTGQIINRVAGDSQHVRHFIQGILIRAVIALITLSIFLVYMIKSQPMLAAACFSVFPLQVLVMTRYSRLTKPKFLRQSKKNDEVVKALQESIAGIRVIRVFGKEKERAELFRERTSELREQGLEIARDQARHSPFVQTANIVAQGLLLGLGGWLVIKGPAEGGIALGTLWIFRGLLDRLSAQAEAIVSIIGETPEALAGAERVFKLLDHPVAIRTPNDAGRARADFSPSNAPTIKGEIEFRDVTFGYHTASPVLRGVSFKARAGEVIALAGPTGSGKSTLLSLIPRFYDPQAGAVLIDGVDVRTLPLESLRRAVGTVFQESFLFSNTVAANVAFGRPDAGIDEVTAAARDASADFIHELSNGFDTIIGERGVSLSGGQRQRLTIARALLGSPAILILDDATGAVDAITEARIHQALDERMRGRTVFIVAHRLSTLRRADRILVLEHGRIVDEGTHDELMTRPGHYRAAAVIQLALDESTIPHALPAPHESESKPR